ncbi:hypothetical protein L6164_001147 [Bauhinia variegata]|uniref:Uncharacterized protein n=1 Tax=Bauhinia variegata TaxID=167791 RepID=A0ACB9QBC9_BAUVA|nr:hypothetical protein L6164_001147 [Bauhinia variegata]
MGIVGMIYQRVRLGQWEIGKMSEETILHVLRDCVKAKQVWDLLVRMEVHRSFNRAELRVWILMNLTDKLGVGDWDWSHTWATGIWLLWSWRNKDLFEANFRRPTNPTMALW